MGNSHGFVLALWILGNLSFCFYGLESEGGQKAKP
jgi:hypothetical protein